jgi:Na+-transporting methylmalonyl-CoA/oxaloacetate decarboxylase gamma subunit
MENPLTISLVVTGVGMLMLFLALSLLYGLMVLMTRVTDVRALFERRPEAGGQGSKGAEEQGSKKQEARDRRRRAAMIGVALARAEGELSTGGAPEAAAVASSRPVSAWRTLHHQRQLTLNPPTRRAR